MAPASDLSPAAQAVLDAGLPHVVHRYSIAAALRAAADQVVPEPPCIDSCCEVRQVIIRAGLLAIAAELEAH